MRTREEILKRFQEYKKEEFTQGVITIMEGYALGWVLGAQGYIDEGEQLGRLKTEQEILERIQYHEEHYKEQKEGASRMAKLLGDNAPSGILSTGFTDIIIIETLKWALGERNPQLELIELKDFDFSKLKEQD